MSSVVTPEVVNTFVMPQALLGSSVTWYPAGTKASRAEIALVSRVSPRSINIVTVSSGNKETVRHIDDPKLMLSPDQRESGAWDFSPFEKKLQATLESFDARIREWALAMAKQLGFKLSYEELKRYATALNIPMKQGTPREEYEMALGIIPKPTPTPAKATKVADVTKTE